MLIRSLVAAIAMPMVCAACQVPDVMFVRTGDAGGVLDAAAIGDGGGAAFAPLHVRVPVLDGFPPVMFASDPVMIDTTALAINGATSAYFVAQRDDAGQMYAVLLASAIDIHAAVKVTGALPLILVSAGPVTIAADIDAGATGTVAGPGAPSSGPGAGGAGSTAVVAGGEVVLSSGGGGGGYGSLGAAGGGAGTDAPSGPGGATYGTGPGDPLVGGSPGGIGGRAADGAGAGGGAIQISSAASITLSSGSVSVGGGGGNGGGGVDGGGGGGAGGEILLEAPVLHIAGTLAANGGGGGGGGAENAAGGVQRLPGPGDSGAATAQPALGGVAGLPGGGPGGNGAAGIDGAFVNAQAGSLAGNEKAGGGGGGAGRIWLRFRAATPADIGDATISPPPGMDPTLP